MEQLPYRKKIMKIRQKVSWVQVRWAGLPVFDSTLSSSEDGTGTGGDVRLNDLTLPSRGEEDDEKQASIARFFKFHSEKHHQVVRTAAGDRRT